MAEKLPEVWARGEIHWARLTKKQAQQDDGKFSFDLCQLDERSVEGLKKAGVEIKVGEGEKAYKGQFVRCSSKFPPKVREKDETTPIDPESVGIGNGSKAMVLTTLSPWTHQGREGVTAYFNAVIIHDLKEYDGAGSNVWDSAPDWN